MQSARGVALRALRRVTEEGAYSNLAIPAELGRAERLSVRDRQFAAELGYGTIRRLIPIDHALARLSSRPLDALHPELLAALRLGAYQLLHARVPPHAAVSETVDLARPRHRGYVNAVLRRLAAEPPSPPAGDTDDDISVRTGLAAWAVRELRRILPADEIEPAAASLASPAGLTLRVNTCRTSPDAAGARLRAAGLEPEPGRFRSDVVRLARGSPASLPGHAEGWFAVQDEASVLVGGAVGATPGERVLDACAGPGGKAGQLACDVRPGGLLVAADVHPRRAGMVREALTRLGLGAAVLVQDARRPALQPAFHAVLVDAPCSGLGSARRRPELLWRPTKSDLSRLARLQVAILDGVASLVEAGGRLVYSVCTFPRAETEAAVRAFLARRSDFRPESVPGPDGSAPAHRLWPHRHHTDAMFIAGFRRAGG